MSAIIESLRESRSAAIEEAKAACEASAKHNRAMSENEQSRYEAAMAKVDQIDERLKRFADTEKRAKETEDFVAKLSGKPVERPGPDSERSWLPGLGEYRQLQAEQRAIGTTGAFIPVGSANTFFDLLRKRTAVLAAGPVRLEVSGAGSLKVPKVTSSVTVGTVAENTAITPSDPGLSDITLDPKKIAAMTLVAREAIEDSQPTLREVVGNSLVKDLAVELDRQLVAGNGGSDMVGLRNITGFTAGASTGTNGGALTFAFLADTLAAYDSANLDPERAAWIMHARTWSSVRKLVDLQGRPIVSVDPTAAVRPTLWGKPVYISNSLSITETVGTSTDCSTLLLCDMSQIVTGVARDVELMISTDYAFNSDQVALRVTCRYDIGAPQPTAIVKTVGVRP